MAYRPKLRAETCKETCGMFGPCGNRFCSNHPKHYEVKGKQPFEKPHRFRKSTSYFI